MERGRRGGLTGEMEGETEWRGGRRRVDRRNGERGRKKWKVNRAMMYIHVYVHKI